MLVTDYTYGTQSSVLYSTASILFAGAIGERDVLFLYGDSDQTHEVSLTLKGNGRQASVSVASFDGPAGHSRHVTVTLRPGIEGVVTLWASESQLVLYADPIAAATFWAPVIPSASAAAFNNYWQFGSNETVLVGGPYLVRNASISEGHLALRGDLNQSTYLTVVAPERVTSVSWNGDDVKTSRLNNSVLAGRLLTEVSVESIRVPELAGWKYADSLPEVHADYSDSEWIVANHTSTHISPAMRYGDGRVLFGECGCFRGLGHVS